ncbi:MAG: hypothetical protein L3J23_02600 [Flavobacteriaceae bacterium]|nr:hypothetical protein [Flavobacteriaceae bacterium]
MKNKIILGLILVLAITGYFGYNYIMASPKDISKAKSDFQISAIEFAKEFAESEKTATIKYQEKVVTVNGIVTATENNSITIDDKITCGFENKVDLKKGDQIKVKGLFIGFDEMFEEVKLDKCSIIN